MLLITALSLRLLLKFFSKLITGFFKNYHSFLFQDLYLAGSDTSLPQLTCLCSPFRIHLGTGANSEVIVTSSTKAQTGVFRSLIWTQGLCTLILLEQVASPVFLVPICAEFKTVKVSTAYLLKELSGESKWCVFAEGNP